MTVLYSTIIDNTYQKSDIYHRISRMREFGQYFSFHEENNPAVVMETLEHFLEKKQEDPRHRSAFREWGQGLWEEFVASGDQSVVIHELYDRVEKSPLIILYVPVELSNKQYDEFGRWFRSTASEDTLIDIKIDPQVLGGCAFSVNNRYYTYTFRKALSVHHDTITDMIRSEELTTEG